MSATFNHDWYCPCLANLISLQRSHKKKKAVVGHRSADRSCARATQPVFSLSRSVLCFICILVRHQVFKCILSIRGTTSRFNTKAKCSELRAKVWVDDLCVETHGQCSVVLYVQQALIDG